MLIASEKAKKGLDHLPKYRALNDALVASFTEDELQTMFSDLRFFFPDERIYARLALFHELDIFEGDHFKIKETYKRRQEARAQQEKDRLLAKFREDHERSAAIRREMMLVHPVNEDITLEFRGDHTVITETSPIKLFQVDRKVIFD